MAYITDRQPEPTSFTGLRSALNADLDRLEPQYLEDGEVRPLRACLIVCYGNKYMVMRHGAISADAVPPNELKVSWK